VLAADRIGVATPPDASSADASVGPQALAKVLHVYDVQRRCFQATLISRQIALFSDRDDGSQLFCHNDVVSVAFEVVRY
jgi:hypothetical protein